MQILTSPSGKAKAKAPDKAVLKKNGTGVQAAREDYPSSTNVSSPVEAMSKRRPTRRPPTVFENSDEEDEDMSEIDDIDIDDDDDLDDDDDDDLDDLDDDEEEEVEDV